MLVFYMTKFHKLASKVGIDNAPPIIAEAICRQAHSLGQPVEDAVATTVAACGLAFTTMAEEELKKDLAYRTGIVDLDMQSIILRRAAQALTTIGIEPQQYAHLNKLDPAYKCASD